MKKVITCLITIILLISSVTAFADDFTLHNGTKFGMTRAEVTEEELKHNFGLNSGMYGEGEIAGYPGAVRYEYHGKGGTLSKCSYFYYSPSQSSYATLSAALTKKYGQPQCSSNDMSYFPVENNYTLSNSTSTIWDMFVELPLTCKSLENIVYETKRVENNAFFYRAMYQCPLYEQWLIPLDDGSAVLIDHTYLKESTLMMDNKTGDAAYKADVKTAPYELIIYTLLSAEEAEKLQSNVSSPSDDL